jgi:hypothetical protein
MQSQTNTNPQMKKITQNARYHGGSSSCTAIPPMTKNATPHTCCQKSSTWIRE